MLKWWPTRAQRMQVRHERAAAQANEERERVLATPEMRAHQARMRISHSVSVLFRPNGEAHVLVSSIPRGGAPRLVDGLPLVVADASDPAALGRAVLDAMERCTYGVMPRRDLRNDDLNDHELLRWANARSWAEYNRHCRDVGVYSEYEDQPTSVRITPMARGYGGVFTPVKAPEWDGEVPVESPEQLGREILAAQALATS